MSAVGWGLSAAAGGPHAAMRIIDTFSFTGSSFVPTIGWLLILVAAVALMPWTARSAFTNGIAVAVGAGSLALIWAACALKSDTMIAFDSGKSALL
jgi:hypothetical protein